MPRTLRHAAGAGRRIALVLLALSLVASASIPGAAGLAAAALLWVVAYVVFEHARPPTVCRLARRHPSPSVRSARHAAPQVTRSGLVVQRGGRGSQDAAS